MASHRAFRMDLLEAAVAALAVIEVTHLVGHIGLEVAAEAVARIEAVAAEWLAGSEASLAELAVGLVELVALVLDQAVGWAKLAIDLAALAALVLQVACR